MLFDIFEYNLELALITYAVVFILLFVFYKSLITSYADPLVFHLLWLSSQITFFVIYADKSGTSYVYFLFLMSIISYTFALFLFCKHYEKVKVRITNYAVRDQQALYVLAINKWRTIVGLLLLTYIYSVNGFISYALRSTNLSDLFLYRFIDLQGRVPLERVLNSSIYFLLFFLIYGIHHGLHKTISKLLIFIILLIGLISGGRATLFVFISFVGTYIFFFSHIIKEKFFRKFNAISVALMVISLIVAALVSSFYEANATVESGFVTIFNRVFAAPDGIEYYLKYTGEKNIGSGVIQYLLSVFGIYAKTIFNFDYKNIGWQLTELVVGDVGFAQGANYTLLLQAAVLNIYLAPFYAIAIAFTVAWLRYSFSRIFILVPFMFLMAMSSFMIAMDLETFVFHILSVSLVYICFIFPVLKLKF